MMLLLSICWLLIGLFVGGLANVAGLRAVVWVYDGRVSMLALGGLAALLGGCLGTWVFGSLFGTAMAVWIAVLGVVVVPRLIRRLRTN